MKSPAIPALFAITIALLPTLVRAGDDALPKSLLIVPWQAPAPAPVIPPPWRHRQPANGTDTGLIEDGVLRYRARYHRRFLSAGRVATAPEGRRTPPLQNTQEEH